jgi:DNA-binding transcriptional LysR family regulator
MRFTHVAEADLNLLLPLYVLLEERQVTRAAARCGLSQPAMSRALQRLRATFGDELLVRSDGKFERTPRAERLLVELADLLARLDAGLRGDRFEPATSRRTFRIACTEYAAAVLLPGLLTSLAVRAPRVEVDVVPWSVGGLENVEAGRVDLALVGIHDCHSLECEELFADGFCCLVAKSHPVMSKRLTLQTFLSYSHVEIKVTSGRTPYIDSSLAAHGVRRRVAHRTQFPLSAALITASSQMIFTTPRRLANVLIRAANLRIIDAPRELADFKYGMAWHRRLDDDAMNCWLRSQVRMAAKALAKQ